MIPLRLRLSGFLSFREPQELDFEGASLWCLAGPNGSGKSAIFDAITWALFGTHRGGNHPTADLIHKGHSRCDVEFDFRIAETSYRIDRSLRLTPGGTSGTQCLYHRVGSEWHPLPETNRKAAFDEWIARHIGTHTVFSATRLLVRSYPTSLLDSSPRVRAEILGSLANLERCERLHEQARHERNLQQALLESYGRQLGLDAIVDDTTFAIATEHLEDAEKSRQDNRVRMRDAERTLQTAHAQAAKWESLNRVRIELVNSEKLLLDADAIEKNHTRLEEYQSILPAAEAVRIARSRIGDSEHRTQRFQKHLESTRRFKENLDAELPARSERRRDLQRQLDVCGSSLATTLSRRSECEEHLRAFELFEKQNAEVARWDAELQNFPADLEAQIAAAKMTVERLESLSRKLPLLERRHREQQDRIELTARRNTKADECDRIRIAGEAARDEHTKADAQSTAASETAKISERAKLTAELREAAARSALERLQSLTHSAACDACGQPLTESHRQQEAVRRTEVLQAADAEHVRAESEWSSRSEVCRSLQQSVARTQSKLQQLRQDYREASEELAALDRHLARTDRTIAEITASLGADDFDPTPDLAAMRLETQRLDAVRRRLQQLQESRTERGHALRQRDLALRVRTPAPTSTVEDLRQIASSLQDEEVAIARNIKSLKQELAEFDRDQEGIARRAHEALTELTDLTGRLRSENEIRDHCRAIIERSASALPGEWQMRLETATAADVEAWKETVRELEAAGTREVWQGLSAARVTIETQRTTIAAMIDAGHGEPHDTVEDAAAALQQAMESLSISEADAANRRGVLQQLESQKARQGSLTQAQTEAVREFANWSRLENLLGPEKLQRHLIQNAEREIVARANSVLNREDNLRLILAEPGTVKGALELNAQCESTLVEAVNIAFLSTGQRFRIALALAVAMLEYTAAIGPQSLFLDEAFAGLDASGQDTLIRELPALSQQLGRVLVIRHDDVPDAFEHSYRFELIHGATKVTRMPAMN